MKHVIIGSAGHVDHGKTTLITALTGINPDRLKEEQDRGMTIDIGFASITLPDGTIADIIDVPGHERFMKNMLAGASGVDVAMLVIAADESVMPQTREHLDILSLLHIENGLVALTKCDLVDSEWIQAVEEDVRQSLKGSFLENAPIIKVSSKTGKGIGALNKALMSAVSRSVSRNTQLPFRLPIDRVFSRTGFGTVVTGTLVSGTIREGDSIVIMPQNLSSRVRGLQVHSARVVQAEAGMRVAVNITGVEREEIKRGSQIVQPGALSPTTLIDCTLEMLPGTGYVLKDYARVRLHTGTDELLGRVKILEDEKEAAPGRKTFIQFRGEQPFVCGRGDRYILRSYSPPHTIGGGMILDVSPVHHKKGNTDLIDRLQSRIRGTALDMVKTLLIGSPLGHSYRDLPALAGITSEEVTSAVEELKENCQIATIGKDRVFHTSVLKAITDRMEQTLDKYHQQFPLRPGMPKEELRVQQRPPIEVKLYNSLLAYWQTSEVLVIEGASVKLHNFQVTLNERQSQLLGRIEDYYRSCGLMSPALEEVSSAVKAPPDAVLSLVQLGLSQGAFVRVSDGIYFDRNTFTALKEQVEDIIKTSGSITVGALRDVNNTNRKAALIALEYLDSIHFTVRKGDARILSLPDSKATDQ